MRFKFFQAAFFGIVLSTTFLVNVAHAGLINFEGISGSGNSQYTYVNGYTQDLGDGFNLSSPSGATFIIGSNYNANWGNGVSSGLHGLGFYSGYSVIDNGGSIFDALSVNAGSVYDNGTSILIEGYLSGTLTHSVTTGIYNLYESSNVILNFTGIDALRFSLLTGGSALVDDIITSSIDVPEPSTLAIFALGMIGLASRRFKK